MKTMRFYLSFVLVAWLVGVGASAQTAKKSASDSAAKGPATAARKAPAPGPAKAGAVMTEDQKTIYALGLSVYRSLSQFDLSPAELEIVKRALTDAAAGKPALDLSTYGPKIDPLAKARAASVATKQKGLATAFLSKAATEPGAVKTSSGLIYREVKAGTGASPAAADTVKVNYRGTFTDGKEFDSSYSRHEPAEFPLNHVIPCWTEGVQKMKVGGKARLVCPSDIAYGDRGNQGIPGGSTLVFEIELLAISGK